MIIIKPWCACTVIKPRCACAARAYSSLFVCLCVCVSVCLCVCVSVCKSLLYLLYGWVLRTSKGLYMKGLIHEQGHVYLDCNLQICPKMLGSRVNGSICSPQYRFELSRRIHRTMHIQRERQDHERQTATVQCALKHSYTKR